MLLRLLMRIFEKEIIKDMSTVNGEMRHIWYGRFLSGLFRKVYTGIQGNLEQAGIQFRIDDRGKYPEFCFYNSK